MAEKQRSTRTKKATTGQKILFGLLIVMTFPWSIIYLVVWSGRCAYCGKRILFNRRVCKKCYRNSHAIVDNFDEKIELFYEQISVVDDITEIITQYDYIFNQFPGIVDIYNALDEEVDVEPLKEKTLITLHRTLEDWMNQHQYQFSLNQAYHDETITEIKDLQADKPFFKDILQPYLEDIEAIQPEVGTETVQV